MNYKTGTLSAMFVVTLIKPRVT